MFNRLKEDIQTVFVKDPAAKNILEVILCYPGLHALWFHRLGGWFYRKEMFTIARIISHVSRHFTGIEIHPGAKIGKRFFIDHGIGVVIGETSEIGDDVLIYQGVVLGGTSLEKKKRHPTIGNKVVIGAGAIILGPVIIGAGVRVGAGSVVVTDVPCGATAVGVPARVGLGFSPKEIHLLQHDKLPDPIAEAIRFVMKEQEKLEERINELEKAEGIVSQVDEEMEKRKKEVEVTFFNEGGGI